LGNLSTGTAHTIGLPLELPVRKLSSADEVDRDGRRSAEISGEWAARRASFRRLGSARLADASHDFQARSRGREPATVDEFQYDDLTSGGQLVCSQDVATEMD
jgi:hypothetical protein